MSNQNIKLAKAIRGLENIRDIQKASTLNHDHYMVGMFNGLELAMSVFTGKDPCYINCEPKDPDYVEPIYIPSSEGQL